MKAQSIVTVPEWFFDKVNSAAHSYHMTLVREYKENDIADNTKLRVNEVLAETEKAYKVTVDAETYSGSPKSFMTWMPKSILK